MDDLQTFALKQEAFIRKLAGDFVERLTVDPLLWLQYTRDDAVLRRSLRAAEEAGVPYVRGVSSIDIRREIDAIRAASNANRFTGEINGFANRTETA